MNTAIDFSAAQVPLDQDGPVFDTPWQASVFSLTVHLHTRGAFSWAEWVKVVSAEIKSAPAQPGERVNDAYYRQWAAAFETLVSSLGLTDAGAISERAEAWRQAYLNTPHGMPVSLGNAGCPPAAEHVHSHGPIAVSQARQTIAVKQHG